MDKVSFGYDQKHIVVKNLDLTIDNRGLTAMTGKNGSGKTTIGKLLAGILKPRSGHVFISGEDTKNMSLGRIGEQVGYLFQDPERQIFAPTVSEELSFVMQLKGYQDKIIEEKVEEMLDMFKLSHLKESFPFYLSRGEKQRLALASVLINRPKFLILDEPTTALDIKRKAELLRILKALITQGVGVLAMSHDHKFVTGHATRVIEVVGGEIYHDTAAKSMG